MDFPRLPRVLGAEGGILPQQTDAATLHTRVCVDSGYHHSRSKRTQGYLFRGDILATEKE